MDLVGDPLPGGGGPGGVVQPGESGAAVHRDPAQELADGVVPGGTGNVPDAVVGIGPVFGRLFDLRGDDRPEFLRELVPGTGVQVDGVQQGPPQVVPAVGAGVVADPYRLGALIPGQVAKGALRRRGRPLTS